MKHKFYLSTPFKISLSALFFLIFAHQANATKFYISAGGNDNNSGRSESLAWLSIARLNATWDSANVIKAGDSVLFRCGDTFYGRIYVKSSGSAANPIFISSYGTGAKPIISGFSTVTGFTNVGTNLWRSATIDSALNTPNMVTIGGVIANIGRFPNSGYRKITSCVADTIIRDSLLSSSPNWTGATVCIRKLHDIIGRDTIISHHDSTIAYAGHTNYPSIYGYGYFIENSLLAVDTANEWFFDRATKKITIYSSGSPTNVKVASKDTLLFIGANDYITVHNLAFQGGNVAAVSFGGPSLGQSIKTIIQYSDISFSGRDAIYGTRDSVCIIDHCNISYSLNNAILLESEGGRSVDAVVTNNIIKYTGTKPGMGYWFAPTYNTSLNAITIFGTNALVQYNSIDTTGHVAISFFYNDVRVKNNFINYHNYITDDGGGINVFDLTYPHQLQTGREISNNIVLNGIGAPDGTPLKDKVVHGIYLDDFSDGVLVKSNGVANSGTGCFYVHNGTNISALSNTFYNAEMTQALFVHDSHAKDTPIRNIQFKYNTLFAKNATQYCNFIRTRDTRIDSIFSSIDSNIYARPTSTTGKIIRTYKLYQVSNPPPEDFTLPVWKSTYAAYDQHSDTTAANAGASSFYYNATTSATTTSLGSTIYLGPDSTIYNNSLTLDPYTSQILIAAGTCSLPGTWSTQDIGPVTPAGSACESSGTFTVQASGLGVFSNVDRFRFTYQNISGNATIKARVRSFKGTGTYPTAGVMIRQNTAEGSKNVFINVRPDLGSQVTYRQTADSATTNLSGSSSTISYPYWVKITRSGDTLRCYLSANGSTWTQKGANIILSMSSGVLVGLAVSNNLNGKVGTAIFDNVTVSNTVARIRTDVPGIAGNISMPENIYPNPASGVFSANFKSSKAEKATVTIINSKGQVVLKQTSNLVQGYNKLDFSSQDLRLVRGVYIVNIVSSKKIFTKKLVIN